jgi:hypothetical protein
MIKKLPNHLFIVLCSLFLVFSFMFLVGSVSAQDISNGTAIGITIKEKNIQNGDIISSENNTYKRATKPYDSSLFGVVSLNPALYLFDEASPKDTPVITQGEVIVRVSTMNGPIQKGDYVTSSTTPGVAQKATDNGTVLGTAGQSYTEKNPKKIGTILVTLHPHFAQLNNNISRNLLKTLTLGSTAAVETPLGALRYVVAGLITLLSFFFGFRFFGRASRSGVEAIGRNPLASKSILLSVSINASITVAIMLFGVAISYLILVL